MNKIFVKRLGELRKDMFEECGGKAAHLGELSALNLLKIRVPEGFCILGDAFYHHLRSNNLFERVREIASMINYGDFKDLEDKTKHIREMIINAQIPSMIEDEIIEHYTKLSYGGQDPFVAVRSSVAVKGTPISSFPGMMDTYHYVRGRKEIISSVKKCWASVWSGEGAFARHNKGIDHWKAVIAPIIQLMVNSEIAGVAFTLNPVSGRKDEIVIESNWGLGEAVVSGKCLSDFYIVCKDSTSIKEKRIANKGLQYIQVKNGSAGWVPVEPDKINRPTLTEAQVKEICDTARLIEGYYGYPQDIEWAFEKGELYILQTRRAKEGGE